MAANSNARGLIASGNIVPSTFLKLSSAADFTAVGTTANSDLIIGVAQECSDFAPGVGAPGNIPAQGSLYAATTGEGIGVYFQDDVCQLVAGSTFNAGTALTSDSAGRGIPASTGNRVGAIALETSTASGNLVSVQVKCFTY